MESKNHKENGNEKSKTNKIIGKAIEKVDPVARM